MDNVWTAEDKEQLVQLNNKEIDMSETYLGRYAALQKRTEDCSCSYSGFYRRRMGVCEEAQGSRWIGRHDRWHWGHYWGIGELKRDYWGYY